MSVCAATAALQRGLPLAVRHLGRVPWDEACDMQLRVVAARNARRAATGSDSGPVRYVFLFLRLLRVNVVLTLGFQGRPAAVRAPAHLHRGPRLPLFRAGTRQAGGSWRGHF
jgi:hypothetical protein